MLQKADVAEVLAAEARRGRSRNGLRVALAVVAIAIVAALGFWAWTAWRGAAVPSYVTDQVSRGDITVTLTASGTLAPTRSISLSSLVAATVLSVEADYNDPVRAGQVLARLDPADLEAARRRAEAARDSATANRDAVRSGVDDARAALTRAEGLDKSRNISSRDLELAGTAFARAQANLAVAEAQLRTAQAELDGAVADLTKANIVSPIDGIVLDRNIEVGETVGPTTLTTPLFTIASDLARLKLNVDVDEADVTQVAPGERATFTVEANPNRLLDGTLAELHSGPQVKDGVTSYVAVIAVDNADLALKPGMTATADIVTDEAKNVLTVASSALRVDLPGETAPAAQPHVFVLRAGKPALVPVTTGVSNGLRTEITGGALDAGDLVITGLGKK